MNVKETDPEALLSLYSIVFQDVTLFDNTIMENIRVGKKDATDAEVMEAAKRANVPEFAENCRMACRRGSVKTARSFPVEKDSVFPLPEPFEGCTDHPVG